jgi:flagellar motor switch protein FliN/FliY
MSEPAPPSDLQLYFTAWAESLSLVLGQITGAPFPFECLPAAPPEAPATADTDLRFMVTAEGTLRGEQVLRLPHAQALHLAQMFLSEPLEASQEFSSDHREAVEELLRQIAGRVVTTLKSRWGEVRLRVEAGASPMWPAADSVWLSAAGGTPPALLLELQCSAALVAAFRSVETERVSPPTPGVQPDKNLDLVMEVELDLTLRFGQRRMLLRDILELGPGSVIELDRQVKEPVELLLEGRVLARGEVVVVEGNYGLQVTEVLSIPLGGKPF